MEGNRFITLEYNQQLVGNDYAFVLSFEYEQFTKAKVKKDRAVNNTRNIRKQAHNNANFCFNKGHKTTKDFRRIL